MTAKKDSYHHGDLRAALLAAALQVINVEGPRGLSMREVARRAQVSHAAPYRHFADKNDLIVAVVEQGFALLAQTIADSKTAAEDDPVSQFTALGAGYFDFALQYPAFYRVMYSGDLLSSSGQHSLRHTSESTFREMVADIKVCQQLQVVRSGDPAVQALLLMSTVHGFVTLVNDNRIDFLLEEGRDVQEIREAVLDAIVKGIGV
ncbi:MAG: AcrR family transcriptional regulator [Paraglaciecola psychrophila]|jgi:AcrR family transcriptional regulator